MAWDTIQDGPGEYLEYNLHCVLLEIATKSPDIDMTHAEHRMLPFGERAGPWQHVYKPCVNTHLPKNSVIFRKPQTECRYDVFLGSIFSRNKKALTRIV